MTEQTENPTDIVIGESSPLCERDEVPTVPAVPDAFQNTKTDPNLELKKEIQRLYPEVDALQMDMCIQIHEELIKLHGENYTEQDYIAYVKSHSSPLCERDESLSKE